MATVIRRARWHSERGAELIEMVVVLPLLLLVLFGIIDFGFMFQRYVVLTNAAMEGARVGILPNYNTGDAETRAETYAETGGIPAGTATAAAAIVTLNEPGGGTWPAMQVTVTHTYSYQYIGPILSIFGGSAGSVNLTANAIMRRQLGS
jgi:Flp pilus assembly protein TadG